MNRFYVSLAVLAAIVAVGLPAAGWLYTAMDAPTAFYLDAFGLVLPFFLVSLYVLKHRRLAPRSVAIPVIVVILGLYALRTTSGTLTRTSSGGPDVLPPLRDDTGSAAGNDRTAPATNASRTTGIACRHIAPVRPHDAPRPARRRADDGRTDLVAGLGGDRGGGFQARPHGAGRRDGWSIVSTMFPGTSR